MIGDIAFQLNILALNAAASCGLAGEAIKLQSTLMHFKLHN